MEAVSAGHEGCARWGRGRGAGRQPYKRDEAAAGGWLVAAAARLGSQRTVISSWNIMLASARCEVTTFESKAGADRRLPSRPKIVFLTADCSP